MGLLTLRQSKLAYQLDFALYGAGVATLGTLLLIASPRADAVAIAACALAGWWSWSAIEYAIHRFVLHGLQPFRRWHEAHHRRPAERIASPTVFSASLIFALVFLPTFELAGAWRASAATWGVLLGYLGYSVTHHATHHWRARTPGGWLHRRKRWHAVHHHDTVGGCCFGVTSPFWDRVMGSAPRR